VITGQVRTARRVQAVREGRRARVRSLPGVGCPDAATALVVSAFDEAHDLAVQATLEAFGLNGLDLGLDGGFDGVRFDGWWEDKAKRIFDKYLSLAQTNGLIGRIVAASERIIGNIDASLRSIPRINAHKYLPAGGRQVAEFRSQAADLIVTAGSQTVSRMSEAIQANPNLHGRDMAKAIQQATGVSRSRAKFWAVDQTLKLHADVVTAKHQSLGIVEYIWRTSGDERVRNNPLGGNHAYLDGSIQRYEGPGPIVDLKTGRRCHAGKDYNCRCTKDPVLPD
jgi:SPP1 gp7 family putative phage head morphogenesis protein